MNLIWPFAIRDESQWRRVDQGQDLQAAVGTPVLAVLDGQIHYAHDPRGFGDPYPVLIAAPYSFYYGHQHPEVAEGHNVRQGDVIAHAAEVPGGNASNLPGWLEIGLWSSGPTGDGQAMHNLLINAPQEDDLFTDADRAVLQRIDQNLDLRDLGPDPSGRPMSVRWVVQYTYKKLLDVAKKVGA